MSILHHRVYGTGKPVIYILHGIFGMLDNWHYIAGKLGETCTVVSMDARNHGKSFHNEFMDFDTMATDILQVMQKLAHTKIVLMGHSMGGKTAMKFAGKYPEMLEKLVVVDIANRSYAASHNNYFLAFEQIDFSKVLNRTEAEKQLEGYAPDLAVRQFLLKNLEALPEGGYKPKFNINAIKANYPQIIQQISVPTPAFSGPSLFIAGENSNYIQESDKPALRKHFPNAIFREIPNAGHWAHADNPIAFLDTLTTFIQS